MKCGVENCGERYVVRTNDLLSCRIMQGRYLGLWVLPVEVVEEIETMCISRHIAFDLNDGHEGGGGR